MSPKHPQVLLGGGSHPLDHQGDPLPDADAGGAEGVTAAGLVQVQVGTGFRITVDGDTMQPLMGAAQAPPDR